MQGSRDLTLAQKLVHSLPFLLALFAALPFTLLFMILVASYWGYFDMGIGGAANGFVLVFAYGPMTLLFLLVLAAALSFVLRRRVRAWLTLVAVLAAMAFSVSGIFAAEAHRTKNYPGLRQEKSMGEFFRWFVHRWFDSHAKKAQPTMQPRKRSGLISSLVRFVNLYTLGTVAIALLLSGCAKGTVTSARFLDVSSGIQIDYILVGAHAFLAEYDRTLHIRFAHREQDFPLEMDSGGYVIQNIYRLPDHRLLLFDGNDCVVVDAQRETVEYLASRPVDNPQYLGCFDWPHGDVLRYIPAAERGEKRPIMSDVHASRPPTI